MPESTEIVEFGQFLKLNVSQGPGFHMLIFGEVDTPIRYSIKIQKMGFNVKWISKFRKKIIIDPEIDP